MNITPKINSGIVSVEDGIKAKEEYAPARKARVELHFDMPEGADHNAHIGAVATLAQAHVTAILSKTAPAPAPAAPVASAPTPAAPAAQKPVKAAKASEKTKADLAKDAGVPVNDTVHKTRAAAPIIEEDELNPAAAEDDLGDVLGDTAPAPITDAELAKAAQTKNALMKQKNPEWQPVKLRELIASYAGAPPWKITDIPVAKRQEFLDKLKRVE